MININYVEENLLNNPVLIYSLVVTSYKMYWFNRTTKPSYPRLLSTYIMSLTSRYVLFPIFIVSDVYYVIDYLKKNVSIV